jgi:hypothetical protein
MERAIRRGAAAAAAFGLYLTLASGTPAEPTAPAPEAVRQAAGRALGFVESGGVGWVSEHGCASCHHVPLTLWSLSEARERGFTVRQEVLDDLRKRALAEYAAHPTFTPHPQDRNGDGVSRALIYLSLAAALAGPLDSDSGAALDRFAEHIVAKQQPSGAWVAGSTPPVIDTDDVTSAWVLLALSAREQKEGLRERWEQSRTRALAWLKESAAADGSQSLALRLLVLSRLAGPPERRVLLGRLRERQNPDGGWSQIAGLPSDAYATGQALYALSAAGVPSSDPVVRRGLAYLLETQREDGSWLVHTRMKIGHDVVISYAGSAWGTLGLLSTLPLASRGGAAERGARTAGRVASPRS